jgi:hypothetical protein
VCKASRVTPGYKAALALPELLAFRAYLVFKGIQESKELQVLLVRPEFKEPPAFRAKQVVMDQQASRE